ncbi:hypothetical protein [Vulcaniibacterium gelatinicum]|uniref:hypothetical protein n=1 Tax=Vulcaniibacterium gelatinicum TaxID=2598725 RepID=UPI0011C8FCD8|nr:hypothetical protein [Vulcaniibacterium gelatinicum]
MTRFFPLILLLAAALGPALSPARAETAQFGVSVRVVDRRAEAALLDALPLPTAAQPLAGGRYDRLYLQPGSPAAAVALYEAALSRQGYQLVARHEGPAGLVAQWRGAAGEVRLWAQPVLGSVPATRLRLQATPSPRDWVAAR